MAVAAKILLANGAGVSGGGGVPLPSFNFPGMPLGFIVSDSTGQNWQLVISSAAVDHTSVEKCVVNPALRWVAYSGGGGGGTVHVTTPITGDGSVGNPLGILSSSAADQTIVGNASGAPAAPTALTATQATSILNPATASLKGLQAAASKSFEDARNGWARDAYATAQAQLGNALTRSREINLDALAETVGAIPANLDGGLEGCGISNTATLLHLTTLGFRAVKTKKWMYAWVGTLPVPTSGKIYQAGIVNSAHSNSLAVASDFALSTTKFVLRGGSSSVGTVNADTNLHTFMVCNDLTNIKMYVDNVDTTAAIATSTITDEPMGPFIYGTDVGTTKILQFLVAWV